MTDLPPHRTIRVLVLALAATLFGAAGAAWLRAHTGFSFDAPIQPTAYRSRSGEWELAVDPTDRDGAGAGRYRMSRGGAVAWEGERPLTFLRAVVADDGRAVGYASTLGIKYGGEHVCALLDASGELHEFARWPNERREHSPSQAAGVESLNIFAWNADTGVLLASFWGAAGNGHPVHVLNSRTPASAVGRAAPRVGAVSTIPRIELPNFARPGELIDLQALPGTPLFVGRWRTNVEPAHASLSTAVFDASLTVVWAQHRPGEISAEFLAAPRSTWAPRVLASAAFEVALPSEHATVRYELRPDPLASSGWTVVEGSRQPWTYQPRVWTASPEAIAISLELLGECALGEPQAREAAPIRHVIAWQVLSGPRIEFVSRERYDGPARCVRVDADGKVLLDVPLPVFAVEPYEPVEWIPLGEGDWLASRKGESKHKPRAWRVEVERAGIEELAYDGLPIVQAFSTNERGFVVLAEEEDSYGSPDLLRGCDARGKKLWQKRRGGFSVGSPEPSASFMPEALAKGAAGRALVLDDDHDVLLWFSSDGILEREITFRSALEHAQVSADAVSCDASGNVLLHLFFDRPSVCVLNADGTLRAKWQPTGPDGREMECVPRMQLDGSVWGCEGGRFWRFDAAGRAEFSIGAPPHADRIGEPGNALVDGYGRVYVQDLQSAWVHAFDSSGRRERVYRPEPNDFESVDDRDRLTAGPDGQFEARGDEGWTVAFASDGSRLGRARWDGTFGWLKAQGSAAPAARWRVQREALELVSADGTVARRIERDRDCRYFLEIEHAAVSARGVVAALDSNSTFFRPRVHVLNPEGAEVSTYACSESVTTDRIAVGEGWVAMYGYGTDCELLRLDSGTWHKFQPPNAPTNRDWTFGFSADGAELWVVDAAGLQLQRYRLPQ
jgi:hypothetical protein